MKHSESRISAHHNYLVNNMLTPGFVLGHPGAKGDFYFLADVVLPGESTPRISGRLFDEQGNLLLELNWNRIGENPGGCSYQSVPGGFRIGYPVEGPLLEVVTQHFTNGYLTRIRGKAHDKAGKVRMESAHDSIRVFGEAILTLDSPFRFPHDA